MRMEEGDGMGDAWEEEVRMGGWRRIEEDKRKMDKGGEEWKMGGKKDERKEEG